MRKLTIFILTFKPKKMTTKQLNDAIALHEAFTYTLEAIKNLKLQFVRNEAYIDDFEDINPINCDSKKIKNREIKERIKMLTEDYNEKVKQLNTI